MFNDKLKEIGKCPVTGLSLKQKNSWKMEFETYYAHPYLLAETIFVINSKGRPSIESVEATIAVFDDAKKVLNVEKLVVITDQKEVKAISAEGRRLYIEHIREENDVIAAVFYHTPKITKISLNLGMSFVNTQVILAVEDDYEDAVFRAFEILSGHKRKRGFVNKSSIKSFAKNHLPKISARNILIFNKYRKNISFEYNLNLLKDFLLNIDWNTESFYNMVDFEDSPFKMIYQAIIFIKSELDNLMKKIYLYQKELEDLNENLENKVIDRTIDLKNTNENLIEAKILAESANKAKDIFLANISHELKTPMNAILGYSSLAIGRIDNIDKAKGEYYFQKINESGKRLMKLLEDLIDIAKLETLNVKYNFENKDLLKVLNDSISSMKYKASEKEVEILTNVDSSIDFTVNIDLIKIRQVIDNLLTNAIKFTKDNTKIEISMIKKDDSILVEFKDQGVGVNNNELLKIFDSFYQSPKTSNLAIKGTGLGLSISKKIINAHNGEIWALNRLDGVIGAVFTFEIPLNNSIN